MPQGDDLLHIVRVVPLSGMRALVGGAGDEGRVDFLAQRAVIGIGHDRMK